MLKVILKQENAADFKQNVSKLIRINSFSFIMYVFVKINK